MKNTESITALYIHIPFCARKCNYCDFNSIEYENSIVDAYINAIEKELDLIRDKYVFRTIYIGGGTPTVLNGNQLKELLNLINGCIDHRELIEYTVEANPGTLSKEKIHILKNNLVNRISLGAQSFNDAHLKTLGRIHTSKNTYNTYSLLRENGFSNINIDLIFGIPYQTVKEWQDDLNLAISLNPEHISTYSLTYENGTVFDKLLSRGVYQKINESDELDMYKSAISLLTNNGFTHYEISNFAKEGNDSLHNLVYWKNQEYIGIGPGACSFINGRRVSNEKDVVKYIQNVDTHKDNTTFSENLPPREHASETLIMGLRMKSGISNNRFLRQTGYQFADIFNTQMSELRKMGFINSNNGRLSLTEKGLFVADSVMMEFLN
ncbi:MAG: radical SAM family heme chaperone HemW [Candidatus Anammoxibacter sp.]